MLIGTLSAALTTKRPDNGPGMQKLARFLLDAFPDAVQDPAGNINLDRRNGSTTAFLAHLDSVESEEGTNPLAWGNDGVVCVDGGGILGADDGAGCALLAHLASRGVPALYVWTTGEESGGIGMRWMLKHTPSIFDGIQHAISFDRKGQTDLIGDQFHGLCASKSCVSALAEALNMGHKWAEGTYTDSSELKGIVPEIINVSVGYENAHTSRETLDVTYLRRLAEALLRVDWETLPVEGPEEEEEDWGRYDQRGYAGSLWECDGMADQYTWDICDALGVLEPTGAQWNAVYEIIRDAMDAGSFESSKMAWWR